MKKLLEYKIEYLGLKTGLHKWNFKVDDLFFACFEYSEYKQGNINVDVVLDKQERMLVFDFNIKGFVNTLCDRCLEELNIDIDGNKRLVFKFGDSYIEETDEIIIIPEKKNFIDLSSFILEFITLMVPLRKVHLDDEHGKSLCNPQVLEKLNHHISEQSIDPRWDKLKDLLN